MRPLLFVVGTAWRGACGDALGCNVFVRRGSALQRSVMLCAVAETYWPLLFIIGGSALVAGAAVAFGRPASVPAVARVGVAVFFWVFTLAPAILILLLQLR